MLSHFLTSQLFTFFLVFCRIGTAIMLLPGFGEAYVSARARLLLAAMFSLVLAPAIPDLPAPPAQVFPLFSLMLAEIMIGLFLGGLSRILIAAIHMAGMVIAYQSSLSSAVVQDLTHAQTQGTALGNMLGVTALVLLFSTDLHHLMLRGLAESYGVFSPGHFPKAEDFSTHALQTMNGAFHMAMQIAAPHLVIGLIFYLGAGIISRLMPNIQIFSLMAAPQLLVSFFILMVCSSAMMLWYMDYIKNALAALLAPS